MKKFIYKITAVILSIMIITGISAGTVTASAMTFDEYSTKYNSFLNDDRWKDGTVYDISTHCKLASNQFVAGCVAYAMDFAKYVFDEDNMYSKTVSFTDADDIRSGDIITVPGHTFVVLERDGNYLYVAQGNMSGLCNTTTTQYYIEDGKLMNIYHGRDDSGKWAAGEDTISSICRCDPSLESGGAVVDATRETTTTQDTVDTTTTVQEGTTDSTQDSANQISAFVNMIVQVFTMVLPYIISFFKSVMTKIG